MTNFRQFVFYATIPVNIAMIAWVWFGRGLLGATLGWIFAMTTFTAVPMLFAMLATSTGLAIAQPRRPGRLTSAQAGVQVGLWLILLVIGAVVVDVDDASYEQSLLINQVGWSPGMLDFSMTLTKLLALLAIICWVALVGLLIAGLRKTAPSAAGRLP